MALGNEPVRVGGEISAGSPAAATATRVERSIAYAYLPAEVALGTAVEVDIFGEWVGGEVAREPLFDPKGERVRDRRADRLAGRLVASRGREDGRCARRLWAVLLRCNGPPGEGATRGRVENGFASNT